MGFALENVSYTVQLSFETCCTCGTPFGIDSFLQKKLRESHNAFYCPNGHSQSYIGKSEAEKLRDQLMEKENQRSKEFLLRLEKEREIERLKKRIGNGVCPCCQRSFQNLRKHMNNKHPKFSDKKATQLKA